MKPDIDAEKPDIEKVFRNKTAQHVLQLQKDFGERKIFGRADVTKEIDGSELDFILENALKIDWPDSIINIEKRYR